VREFSRRSRRDVLRLGGLVAGSAVLAACGGTASTPAPAATTAGEAAAETPAAASTGPVTIAYWHLWSGRYAEIQQSIVDTFMGEQDQIKVDVLPVPSNIRDKILTAVAAGQPPDVATNGDCQTMAVAGALTDISPFVEARGTDLTAIYPILLEGTMWNGKQWGFPANAGVEAFYYSKGKLTEAGIDTGEGPMGWEGPATWEEFLEVNKSLTKMDDSGAIVESGALAWAVRCLEVWFWTNGSVAYDKASETLSINKPENVEALQYLVDYCNELYGSIDRANDFSSAFGSAQDSPFCTGIQGIIYDGNWAISTYHDW